MHSFFNRPPVTKFSHCEIPAMAMLDEAKKMLENMTMDNASRYLQEISSMQQSEYNPTTVKKLIREIQSDQLFLAPLDATDASKLRTELVNPLHKVWGLLIESYITHLLTTKTPEEIYRINWNEERRLYVNYVTDDGCIDIPNENKYGNECLGIRFGLMFDNARDEDENNIGNQMLCGHSFYPEIEQENDLRIKLIELWRLLTNKHYTNCPDETALYYASSAAVFPCNKMIQSEQTILFDDDARICKMLTWDSNKGFTVNTIDLKESVKPNLIARRLVHCHAVIVREVETNRVWLAHVSPAEISGGYNDPYSAIAMTAKGADPAYVQFAEKAFSHHNSNCPHGEIDVVVADVYHTFNEDKFRKFVSAQCTIRNLSVIDNDDPSLFNGHDVYYNTKNDTLYLKSNDSKHVIIQHNNVFQRKEMTYTPK